MTWQLWCIVGVLALNALVAIGSVGKKREPLEPSTAVFVVIFDAVLISLIVWGSHA